MRAYAAIFSARCRTLLQYRAAALAGIGCQFFFGFVRIAMFQAFYAMSDKPQPISLPQTITYVWLGQAFIRAIPFGADGDVRGLVNSGGIVYELARPLDLYNLWYSRSVAALTAPMFLRAVPLLAVCALFFGLQAPASLGSALAFALSAFSAILLSASIQALMTISLLWTISGDGISRLVQICAWMFSGIVLPLPLYPEWLQPIINFLPFRGLLDLPLRLYVGQIPPADAIPALAHQLAWTFVLVALGRWILSIGTRRLVVQGG